MKKPSSLPIFVVLLFITLLGIPSCRKDRKGSEVPDPQMEKKEAQQKYEAAISLIEDGTRADFSRALDLLEEAAEQGIDSAQVVAGALFEYGKGTSADMDKAKEYYMLAAAQGNQVAKEKLHILEISKSRLDVPEGFSTPMNEILVWNADTLRVINGDASFFSSEKNVMVVDKDLHPIYVSFRALEGKSATEPIQLDARETAVSLLLLSIPYALNMENDHYLTLLREMLNGMPETEVLANAIQMSVGRNGHYVYEEVQNEMDAAIRQVNKKLKLDSVNLPQKNSVRRASGMELSSLYPSWNDGTPSAVSRSIRAESVGIPRIAWGASYNFLKTKVDGEYRNGSGGHLEWKVTVANEMPMYFLLEHGYLEEMEMSGDELRAWREKNGLTNDFVIDNMVKPTNLSEFFDMAGVNGLDALCDAYSTIWDDLGTIFAAWYRGERVDYFDKSFGKQMVSTWIPIDSNRDVLYISSLDRHPELFLAGVFDMILIPVLTQCLSEFLSDNSGIGGPVYSALLEAFMSSIDSEMLYKLQETLSNKQIREFTALLSNHVKEWATTGFHDIMTDLVKNGLIRVAAYDSLVANGCLFPALMTEAMSTAIVAQIDALFTMSKWLEIAVNAAAWLLYQLTTDSYSVGFIASIDGVPETLKAVDMGLSVKWASCNVGATSYWGSGWYYAWGETYDKVSYEWDSYRFGTSSSSLSKYTRSDGLTVLQPDDDVATRMWGEKWRTPTAKEFQELMDNCTFTVRNKWGQRGYLVTSKINGNSIFLPSAGSSVSSPVLEGRYWTANLLPDNPAYAQTFETNTGTQNGTFGFNQFRRSGGMSVRAVQDAGAPKIKGSSTYLEFSDTKIGDASVLEWMVTNIGTATLDVYSFTVPDCFYTDFSSWSVKSLDPGSSHTFRVTFKPTQAKEYSGKMVFKSNAGDVQISVIGKGIEPGKPAISLSPSALDFGEVTVGETKGNEAGRVRVTNTGNADLVISGINCSAGFSYSHNLSFPRTVAAGDTWTVTFAFKPTQEKTYSGSIVFHSNAGDARVSATGKGVEHNYPQIDLSPSVIDFGNVTIGESSKKSITVRNIGNATLEVNKIAFTGGSNAPFRVNKTALSLAAGASITITVTFTPREEGFTNDFVYFKSNSQTYDYKSVEVRGRGVQAVAGAVDLGLSVRWASCNLGASSPEEYGNYYAWGETSTKDHYSIDNYKWWTSDFVMDLTNLRASSGKILRYNNGSKWGPVDNRMTLLLSDDAARVNLGTPWRMPTWDEMMELKYSCTWTWSTYRGVRGFKVTGPNGNWIFLPASGAWCDWDSLYSVGTRGLYWSSSLTEYVDTNSGREPYPANANHLDLSQGYITEGGGLRYWGESIRPVCD